MNYIKIIPNDTVNGEGIRVSLFVSGCSFACEGCYNKTAWDYKAGERFTSSTVGEILHLLGNDHVAGLSILGGEPLADKNVFAIGCLCVATKARFPNKSIWLWTGYTLDEIKACQNKSRVLQYADVLIDGKYEESLRDTTLKWRGSSNQRVLQRGIDF